MQRTSENCPSSKIFISKMAKSIVVILFAMAFTTTLVTSSSLPNRAQREVLERLQNNAEFETIGQIGNKMFVAFTRVGSAMVGRDACADGGLEYATFKDDSEFLFVFDKIKSDMWISAFLRGQYNAYTADAFQWIGDGGSIPNGLGFHMWSEHWICLYFSGDGHTYTDFCLSGQHQTLCQLQFG